jgi:TonB family protein
MKTRIFGSLCIVMALASPASAQQASLAVARDLYASARYDEALAVLNGMPATGGPSDRRAIEQYRSLCLLALGRGSEAESAIAAVVTVDPLFVPGESEASPRVRAAFSDVRQRLLPEIARARYATAKATYDRKEHAQAEREFRALLSLLDDPQMAGRLGDLRVITAGFLELSAAAAAPPPEPKKADPAPQPPPPAQVAAPSPARMAQQAPGRIWDGDDAGVTPPAPIRQDMPKVPAVIASQARERGLLELIIDEQGRVTGITLRKTMHPMYDAQVMAAAREWKYRPAVVAGVPVKFRKLIEITIGKR